MHLQLAIGWTTRTVTVMVVVVVLKPKKRCSLPALVALNMQHPR
jgi:hypothetical protein